MTNTKGTLSYLAARSRWAEWWLRIIMLTMFDAVAKPITSEIKLNYVELVHQPPYQWIMLPKQMMNVNPPTVSQDRTRPLLNNSGYQFS